MNKEKQKDKQAIQIVKINALTQEKDRESGLLLRVDINGLIWKLNYRGDSPLQILHSNGVHHILQIDGNFFDVVDAIRNETEELDNGQQFKHHIYFIPLETTTVLLNVLLYQAMNLEYDPALEDDEQHTEYDIDYIGTKEEAFDTIYSKIEKQELITEEDIISLMEDEE